LLIINIDNMDFLNNKEDFAAIVEKIDKEINGLF
jgi:deoxyadenosine/deoxycytidine kinase